MILTHDMGFAKLITIQIYNLEKRGDKDKFYGYNPHHGWNKLSTDALDLISTAKIKKGKSTWYLGIILNVAGNRIKSNDNDSVEGENRMLPPRYQQSYYPLKSGCVWQSAYLVIRSKGSHLYNYLLTKYDTDCKA